MDSSPIEARLEKCRVRLKDIEKLRSTLETLDKLELFDGLFNQAFHILQRIHRSTESSEMYLLLDECQGILDSLQFSLDRGKYGKRKTTYGKGPQHTPSTPISRQTVSRPNSYLNEPLPRKDKNTESPENDGDLVPTKMTIASKHFMSKHSTQISLRPQVKQRFHKDGLDDKKD